MNKKQALNGTNKIFEAIFDYENPFTLEEVQSKFAFDVKLPKQVQDSTTGETTWASSIHSKKYITQSNTEKIDTWMHQKIEINNLEDIIKLWDKTNYTTTERLVDSINVAESDTIYNSENVFRSVNSGSSKNIIFCDGIFDSEFVLASQRSNSLNFCIRVDDSSKCTNSYNVSFSTNISNSLFIQDCANLHECIFCSHINNKKYCIANMQFEEEEYFKIKKEIIKWIMNS